MRKINNVPVEAHTDLSNLTGGEVLKWDADSGKMVWELQDGTDYVPVYWYGGRGIFLGRNPSSANDTIDYITIASTGNAIDFGDQSTASEATRGVTNSTRGVISGYSDNRIDYITISTTGNATDFGDTTASRSNCGSLSDGTTGLFCGGVSSNVIDYITISTTGNATDFGDMSTAAAYSSGGSNGARGVVASVGDMEYITIASTGNASDFGDLSVDTRTPNGTDNATRAIFIGGYDGGGSEYSNVIEYITISSTGNASDFGNLWTGLNGVGAASNGTGDRGVFAGGVVWDDSRKNEISYVTISSTSDSTDFGDLTTNGMGANGMSGD